MRAKLDGFNVIAAPQHPYGSDSAGQALDAARRAGAQASAVSDRCRFLWQRDPPHAEDPSVGRGEDMPDAVLRLAIRQAHAAGLKALVKPHVWVQGSWAGAVEPATAEDWRDMVRPLSRGARCQIARIAAEEGAEALVIGTELEKTTRRPEWLDIIAAVRPVYAECFLSTPRTTSRRRNPSRSGPEARCHRRDALSTARRRSRSRQAARLNRHERRQAERLDVLSKIAWASR